MTTTVVSFQTGGHAAAHSQSASQAFVAAQALPKPIPVVLGLTQEQTRNFELWNGTSLYPGILNIVEVARAVFAPNKENGKPASYSERLSKVLDLDKLRKHLGTEDYEFLIDFLKNEQAIDLDGAFDSPKGLSLLVKIGNDHKRFLHILDKKLNSLVADHPDVIIDSKIRNRLEQGKQLGLAVQVRDLSEKLDRAIHFWTSLNAKTAGQFTKPEIAAVVNGFFSRFSKGLVKATDKDIADIVTTLKRIQSSKEIAKSANQLLRLTKIDSANQKIHDKGVLLEASRAQIEFDKHLQKLKLLDAHHLECEKARTEQQLFEALNRVLWKDLPQFLDSLSPSDKELAQAILKERRKSLSEEALSQTAPFAVCAQRAKDYVGHQESRIEKLNKILEVEAANRARNPRGDFIHPNSIAIELLLAKMEWFSSPEKTKKKIKELETKNNQIQRLLAAPDSSLSEIERKNLKEESDRLVSFSTNLFRFDTAREYTPAPIAPFFDDYLVFPMGNVIYRELDEVGNSHKCSGQWAVIDLSALSKMKGVKEDILKKLNPSLLVELKHLWNGDQNAVLSFDTDFNLSAQGPVKIFFESAKVAKDMHADRGIGKRTRLVIENGKFERRITDPERSSGWDKTKELTAAVDRLEAIWTSRIILKDILASRSDLMDSASLLNVEEYLATVEASDLARIGDNSYATDDSYRQATTDIFNGIVLSLGGLISERLNLESLTKNSVRKKYDLIGAVHALSTDLINPVKNWLEAIGTFLEKIPEDLKIKNRWDSSKHTLKPGLQRYVDEFKRIRPILEMYYLGFPPELRAINELKNPNAVQKYVNENKIDLDALIYQTLHGQGEQPKKLSARLNELYQYLNNLAVWEANPAIRDRMRETLGKTESQVFKAAADKAIPNSFQLATRVEGPLLGLTELISELSPLSAEIRSEWVAVKQRVLLIEKQRATETKKLLRLKDVQAAWREFTDLSLPATSAAILSPVERPPSPDAAPAARSLTISPAARSSTSVSFASNSSDAPVARSSTITARQGFVSSAPSRPVQADEPADVKRDD